jgi:hypothetical protein
LGKPNFTRLAKQLGVDRRTVKKYYEGRNKNEQKRKGSKIDSYKEIIDKLLSTDNKTQQIFYYKIHLYRYLVREYGLKCSRSNFNRYILLNKQYSEYFNPKECPNAIKTETQFGKQAHIDWKEKVRFYLKMVSLLGGPALFRLFDRNLLILFDRPFCPLALSACDADRALMSTNSILPQQ